MENQELVIATSDDLGNYLKQVQAIVVQQHRKAIERQACTLVQEQLVRASHVLGEASEMIKANPY